MVVALRVRVAGLSLWGALLKEEATEVGEEGERKGEVNRSEVKWNWKGRGAKPRGREVGS